MKEEQGKKLDPNDPAIPAKPDKPTALADEDLDKVAGGLKGLSSGSDSTELMSGSDSGIGDASKRTHSYKGIVTLVK